MRHFNGSRTANDLVTERTFRVTQLRAHQREEGAKSLPTCKSKVAGQVINEVTRPRH